MHHAPQLTIGGRLGLLIFQVQVAQLEEGGRGKTIKQATLYNMHKDKGHTGKPIASGHCQRDDGRTMWPLHLLS